MSVQAEAWVERHSPVRGTTYAVHRAIAEVVNEQRRYLFYGAAVTLSKRLRLSRSTVSNALAELVQRGLIEVVRPPTVGYVHVDDGRGGTRRQPKGTGRPGVYRFLFVADLPVVFDGHGGEVEESTDLDMIAAQETSGGGGAQIQSPPPEREPHGGISAVHSPEIGPIPAHNEGGAQNQAPPPRSGHRRADPGRGAQIRARTGVQLQPTTPPTPPPSGGAKRPSASNPRALGTNPRGAKAPAPEDQAVAAFYARLERSHAEARARDAAATAAPPPPDLRALIRGGTR